MKRFSVEEIERKYSIRRRVVSVMVKGGFVQPARGKRREYQFSFKDVTLLRMAQELFDAGFPPARTARFLQQIAGAREVDLPNTRVTACGNEMVVREGATLRNQSGQLIINFAPPVPEKVASLTRRLPVHEASNLSADEWYCAAQYIETSDPLKAVEYYKKALEIDDLHGDSYVNLCCLLVEGEQWLEARVVAEEAISKCPNVALLHYNLAVIYEEFGMYPEALQNYAQSLELDPHLADAHYNLSLLHEALGQGAAALRHLREYRKLSQ